MQEIAYCPGWGDGPEDLLDECHDCQRRTEAASRAGSDPAQVGFALRLRDGSLPPQIVTLWCDAYIPPDRPDDQRLKRLAQQPEKHP